MFHLKIISGMSRKHYASRSLTLNAHQEEIKRLREASLKDQDDLNESTQPECLSPDFPRQSQTLDFMHAEQSSNLVCDENLTCEDQEDDDENDEDPDEQQEASFFFSFQSIISVYAVWNNR